MLKLTQDNGMPIYLRFEGILAVASANDKTIVYIGGGMSFQVKETIEELEKLMTLPTARRAK